MNYIAQPLSRQQIRQYVHTIRKVLHLENELMFPVERFLESIHCLISDDDFYYEIVDDNSLPGNVHAQYDLQDNSIKIKQSVYDGACNGNGRDRMTIIHEIGHLLLLKHSSMKLARSFDADIPPYMDPEWQAKCFAGEMLVPADLVKGMPAQEVSERCGVSLMAATMQLKTIK